eukprot:XP_015570762.2 receptor-like protein EIX2 [Ricinus communis]
MHFPRSSHSKYKLSFSICMVITRSMRTVHVALPFLLFLLATTIISVGLCFNASGCNQIEKEALLMFKHGLTDPSSRLASWGYDADCCTWFGVICDDFTGHVIELQLSTPSYAASNFTGDYEEYWERSAFGGKISHSLVNLKHLISFDLSHNNFEGIQIPRFLGSMGSLRFLDLSSAGFGGMIPHQLGNLSNLQYLNINVDQFENNYTLYVESLNWVSGLASLEFLALSGVDLSKAIDWFDVLNTLPSLVELHLSLCQLYQVNPAPLPSANFSSLAILDLSRNNLGLSVPHWIFSLEKLTSLCLSNNSFVEEIPIHLLNLTSLEKLVLSHNNFNSSIPSAIGNLTSLNLLDLSGNSLEGGIPIASKNLCNLRLLDLSFNKLSQEINEVFEILSKCAPERLKLLDLSSNHLPGHFTNRLEQFKNLVFLSVYDNSISGPIPEILGELKFLEDIDISKNLLKGDVSEIHFANLTNLRYFYAAGNQLSLRVSPDWVPPFQGLTSLHLRYWQVGPQFPSWIRSLKQLNHLDLSYSKISSTLPLWFLNLSFSSFFIDLSHNQMHGNIPYINLSTTGSMDSVESWIDLSSNHFEGPLPRVSSNLQLLNLPNNSFSGSISNLLCDKMHELKAIRFLSLRGNRLSGEIPDCWKNLKDLEFIDLSNNNFSGKIPKSIGTLSQLKFLYLNNNKLSGEIPFSLQHCNKLLLIDLSENELGGDISTWIGKRLSQLVFLKLRGNKFHGHISEKLCHMTSLQILDLACNNFNGTIPICINKLSAMVADLNSEEEAFTLVVDGYSLIEGSSIMTKGRMANYGSFLRLVRSIDLSDNQLCGEIPKGITSIRGLRF